MITIVDYGLGNIQAFCNIYRRLDIDVAVGRTADEISAASKLILPGVGAFDWAMTKLNSSGVREPLDELVLQRGVPVLGVCVGMQMMADMSEEGVLPGLEWISGQVKRFRRCVDDVAEPKSFQLPHMGWNGATALRDRGLFAGLSEAEYYFLHSYYFEPQDGSNFLAVTDYVDKFASAVGKDNMYGVQFHPEKSHHAGIKLLKNFAEL